MAALSEADKAAIVAVLDAELDRRNADYHLASLTETDTLSGVRDYIESTQPLDRLALAEVAYAWLDGYRFGAERYAGTRDARGTREATRPAYAMLGKAGLAL